MTQGTAEVLREPIVDARLDPAPIPPQDIIEGSPKAAVSVLWSNEERTLFNGIWHCTPGVFYLDHADETVALIEGRATVTLANGKSVELRAGDVGFVPAGRRVKWEVHETVKKAFHNYDATGQLLREG
jgi:uncharacterized cupin superfamily protein